MAPANDKKKLKILKNRSDIQRRDDRTKYLWKKLRRHTDLLIKQTRILNRLGGGLRKENVVANDNQDTEIVDEEDLEIEK